MDITTFNFWGKTKYWWIILLAGVILVPSGFWLLFRPVMGYAFVSLLFGWGLIVIGILQLVVAGSIDRRVHGWGWWLAGGIIDIFIGFVLVSNLALTQMMLPFLFAFVFLYKGLSNIVSSFTMTSTYKYWWMYLINGIFMLIISLLFFFSPLAASYTILFLCSFVFIYWGISLIVFSMDLRPVRAESAGYAE